jgi:hypothetical protein
VTSHNFIQLEKNSKINLNIQFKKIYEHEESLFLMANTPYSYKMEFTSESVNFSSFDIILINPKDKTYTVTIGTTKIILDKKNNYTNCRMINYFIDIEWLIEITKPHKIEL